MVLNDWQRGRIPFFVKPPNAEQPPEVIDFFCGVVIVEMDVRVA